MGTKDILIIQRLGRTPSEARTLVRRVAGLHASDTRPIVIVRGNTPPRCVGESYFETTPAGDRIHHPSAYRRKGYQTTYHHSTRRVEVGATWLAMRKLRVS